MFKYYDPD